MALFPDQFLDDLRARVPVSEVAGRKVKLKKQGREFVGLSPFQQEKTPSFTVNDEKGFYHDFSSGKHGDVFAFVMETEGKDFPQAVADVAAIAGVPLPKAPANGHDPLRRGENKSRSSAAEDQANVAADDSAGVAGNDRDGGGPADRGRRITCTYDYTDAQGALIYQVCRIEWTDDGKKKKTFIQRRPAPDGAWIWGLKAGEFVKSRDGDWYQLTEDREQWSGERRKFTDAVAHGLYRLVEFNELKSADEPVFILEGEKDVDTGRAWDLIATTNSGGARNWRPDHAELFRGLDVVIPIDNDQAGRDRGDMIAKSLRRIARSVRVLDWAAVWQQAPKGADLTDWKEQAAGTPAKLRAIVEKLPQWTPPPFTSKYGLIMWGDHTKPGDEYEYLIEDLFPEREAVLIMGETQTGKSFLTMRAAYDGARGSDFFGRRVLEPFGSVYCAYEAGKGFKYRMAAHDICFGKPRRQLPFAVLTKPIDLWSAEINTDQLIEEILAIADSQFGDVRLGAVIIDTHNRANPGASEIDSKDISRIIDRYSRIMDRTRAGVWIIGHKNAAGKHRGNEQLYNNIETAIDVSRKVQEINKEKFPIRDYNGRAIRVATVLKQREGIDGESFEFVLQREEVGINRYGKPRTSCVAVLPAAADGYEPAEQRQKAKDLSLPAEVRTVLQALKNAIEEHGEAPPVGLKLPKSIKRAVKARHWKEAYLKVAPDADTAKDNTINARLKRASEKLQSLRVIGRSNPWVWITGRPVQGEIERSSPYENPLPGRPEPPVQTDLLEPEK